MAQQQSKNIEKPDVGTPVPLTLDMVELMANNTQQPLTTSSVSGTTKRSLPIPIYRMPSVQPTVVLCRRMPPLSDTRRLPVATSDVLKGPAWVSAPWLLPPLVTNLSVAPTVVPYRLCSPIPI
jgi:hypothetical protein